MKRWRIEAGVLTALTLMSGCAFDDGNPWGEGDVHLAVRFDPSASRLDENGALRTSEDFIVAIETLAVEVHGLEIERAGQVVGAFDPANPPAGYSLCHNGHCHADDGRLVDYEDIATDTGGGTIALSLVGDERPLVLNRMPTDVGFEACPEGCVLPRGTLSRMAIDVGRLALRAVVRHATRLPPEGVAIDVDLELEASVDGALEAKVDAGESLGVRLDALLDLPSGLFDTTPFDQLDTTTGTGADALAAILRQNIGEHAELAISVSRFE